MKRFLTPLLAVCLVGGLAACSGAGSTTTSTAPTAEIGTAGYPLTISNCGHELHFDKAPEHTATLNQSTTEIHLSLGLADKMVGTATWTDAVLPDLEADNAKVPRLADNAASMEAIMAVAPDFVAASFNATLSEKNSGSFDDWAKVGVPAYISPTDCTVDNSNADTGDGARGHDFTIDEVYQEITDLAAIHGIPDEGEELIDSLRTRMQAVKAVNDPDITVVFWFANSEAPYVAGGSGVSQFVADTLGVTNAYADQADQWPQVSWEDIAAKNPDILVIGDLTRKSQTAETAQAKIDFLMSNPVTAQMDAVVNERFVKVAGGDMNPSIRAVGLAEKLAAGIEAAELK